MQLNKKPTLIFVFPYPITEWDAYRYGFASLMARGITVQVFDLSALFGRENESSNTIKNVKYIKKIISFKTLDRAIAETHNNAIYVDCINGINGLQWRGRQIFRLFKKYNARYFLIEIGSLPLVATSGKKNHLQLLRKALNLPKLITFLKWKLGKKWVDWQTRYQSRYQLPEKIFVGHTELVNHYLSHYELSPTHVVRIHSFDYDRYLEYKNSQKPPILQGKIAVFIDQALTHHRDFGVKGSGINANHYFNSLNHFFKKIEEETGVRVVIAASPRGKIEELKGVFQNRPIFTNQTVQLIAQSDCVFMHYSTAVSFAVLFDKPIVLIKTMDMLKTNLGRHVDNIATSLEIAPVLIDDPAKVTEFNLKQHLNLKKRYSNYKNKYVKTEGLPDKTTWEFVVDHL